MSIIQTQTNSFKTELFSGYHAFTSLYRPADTFMIALYTDQSQLDATTTAYSTTNEVVGSGYTAGGQVVTLVANPTNTGINTGGITYFTFNTVIWSPATFVANGALIYNATQSNRSVCVLSFGLDISCQNAFTVTFPGNAANSALLRYQ